MAKNSPRGKQIQPEVYRIAGLVLPKKSLQLRHNGQCLC